MTEKKSIWSELRRRHVVRAAVAHIVLFWLLVQVADVVLPYLGVVDQPVRWAFVAGVALFPVTVVVAWFFEHPWHHLTSSRLFIDVAIIAVIAVAAGIWVSKNIPQVIHARTSIVVLPFEYGSDDPLGHSLSRALALEINSLLMKSRSIDVVGYESANSEVLRGLDIPGIVDVLGVQHVLSGVISSAEASMSVSVRLHDENGQELWSDQLEDELDHIYAVQENIAQEIQNRLGESDTGVSVQSIANQRCPMPSSPDALERFYTARHYYEARTESEESRKQLLEAKALYEGLIEEYPDFAQAYSGLAWTQHKRANYDRENVDPQAVENQKRELAKKAYELCPNLGEALMFLPNEADHPNPWINVLQHMELWLSMQPDSLEARQSLVFHYREVGRVVDALNLAEESYRLNPLSIRSIMLLSRIYMYLERMEEAIELENRTFELGSTAPPFARQMNALVACENDVDCILENLPPPFAPHKELLRAIYSAPANENEARKKIEMAMQAVEQTRMVNWFNGATCNFDHLTDLYPLIWDFSQQAGEYWFWPNSWGPNCGNVWSSEEFPRIVEEAGLVEYWRATSWPDACEPTGEDFSCSEEIWRQKSEAAGLAIPGHGP